MRVRFYIKVDEKWMRLPMHFFNRGKHITRYPSQADQTRKAVYAVDNGHFIELKETYVSFDAEGAWDSSACAKRGMQLWEAADLEDRMKRMKVPDLRMAIKARELRDDWEMSDDDEAAIFDDFLPVNPGESRNALPIIKRAI